MADRQNEFLDRGARVYGLSADSPLQNSAVMDKIAIPFPILSDFERDKAIIPLGFEDEGDPRHISRPGVAIISSAGEIVHRFVGRDYADRPIEDELLVELEALNLDPVTQEVAQPGEIEHGEKAFPAEGLKYYFSGAKFANLALRRRYRHISDEFKDDTKAYVAMIDRYLAALSAARARKG